MPSVRRFSEDRGLASRGTPVSVPRTYALVWPAYGAAVLAADTQVGICGERLLGVVTWVAFLAALRPLLPVERAQAIAVVAFATLGEVNGSIVWGLYHYRLHNLPLFVPPGHGLIYLSGLALARALGERPAILAALAGSLAWGLMGLTVLPRPDDAGAFGVAVLCFVLWRSRARAAYAGVFFVVTALELYGTAIGAWRWTSSLPGLGIRDGNPPSGAASGYVLFDLLALLVAPGLLHTARAATSRLEHIL